MQALEFIDAKFINYRLICDDFAPQFDSPQPYKISAMHLKTTYKKPYTQKINPTN